MDKPPRPTETIVRIMEPPLHEVTLLLNELSSGNRQALDQLLPLVYGQLRGMAHRQRLRWQGEETLNTTALVNEAYLRLVGSAQLDLESRKHFLRVAAQAMRFILIDHAKAKRAQKRGGHQQRVDFEEALVVTEAQADELIAIDEALTRLKQIHERQAEVIECRFFAGLTIEETATVLNLAPATVKRDWQRARVWLLREMRRDE